MASRLEESTAMGWGAAWNNENGLTSNLSVSCGIIIVLVELRSEFPAIHTCTCVQTGELRGVS